MPFKPIYNHYTPHGSTHLVGDTSAKESSSWCYVLYRSCTYLVLFQGRNLLLCFMLGILPPSFSTWIKCSEDVCCKLPLQSWLLGCNEWSQGRFRDVMRPRVGSTMVGNMIITFLISILIITVIMLLHLQSL